jgi:serine protease
MTQSVAMGPAGDFVIAWETVPSGSSVVQAYARHFDANNAALTGDVQVTTEANTINHHPNVALDPSGGFIVTWYDWHTQPTLQSQVLARYYTSAGIALGPQFVVPTNTTMINHSPVIAMDRDGSATIAWRQRDPVTGDEDVAVRRYPPVGITVQPIADGATIDGLTGAAGSWQYFKVTVPPGHSTVDVFLSGNAGDADLYVRYGAIPSATSWDGRPFLNGSNEGVEMLNFPAGDWYIGINGFTAYSSLRLQVNSR